MAAGVAPALEVPGRLARPRHAGAGPAQACRVASAYPANTQEQIVVPSQGVNVPLFVQTRAEQHGVPPTEHVWPSWMQLPPGWQVPLVWPEGMTQL